MGNVFKNIGNLDDAINAYKRAILLKPYFAEAYSNIGCVFEINRNLDLSIEAYKKAIELKLDAAEIFVNLGNVLKGQVN